MDQVKFRYILFGGVVTVISTSLSFILIYISCGGSGSFDGP